MKHLYEFGANKLRHVLHKLNYNSGQQQNAYLPAPVIVAKSMKSMLELFPFPFYCKLLVQCKSVVTTIIYTM